ncbi:MAG: LysM peptidoglycan-binding domain-containing protein [Candidatus Dormibacteraeota bacterium]|nr:LysM peptidoglycan-binding domain-containing protein [Candidatus Dormibacteraeota bacterium]
MVAAALAAGGSTASAYTVQPGEDLWQISQRTGEPVSRLVSENRLGDANQVSAGRNLKVDGNPAGHQPAASPARGRTYTVRQGDTLYRVSRRTGVPVPLLAQLNHLSDPNHLRLGQVLSLAGAPAPASSPAPSKSQPSANPAPPAAAPPRDSTHGEQAKQILRRAAAQLGVEPAFVLAVSEWESGRNQAALSPTGAVGLMQVEPYTADWAGPALLGRRVDLNNPRDNALLGTALLRKYLGDFHGDKALVLASYYQGESATQKSGIYPGSHTYVDGILRLYHRYSNS